MLKAVSSRCYCFPPVINEMASSALVTAQKLNMTKLSPSVFLYRPAPGSLEADPMAPRLLFLATWMDARDEHIAKYVVRYQALYPTACILVTKSFFRYYFSPSSARREVEPAVHVIQDFIDQSSTKENPQMLIHVFSNGGSCMLYHLYDLYGETVKKSPDKENSHLIPSHVTIFDSVPGRWSWFESPRAIIFSLPAGWVRMLASPLVYLLGLWWVIKYWLLKRPEETHVWGLAHNDRERARETRRAYIYSEADKFVEYGAVEEHADHAESNGYVVLCRKKFIDSQHVAHARSHPDQYWSVVRDVWEGKTE